MAENSGIVDCSEVEKNLAAYVLGELDETLAQDLASSLDNCPDCQAKYEELKEALQSLDVLEDDAPSGLAQRTIDSLPSE